MASLFTKEDRFHIHKILGLLCLLNYILQIGHSLIYGTTYRLDITLWPHFLLHLSTFIFHVRAKRTSQSKRTKYMIWSEMRWHALIFAYRAILVMWFPEYRVPIVFLAMFLADVASKLTGDSNETTVRGIKGKQRSFMSTLYGSLFSSSQLGATILCLGLFDGEIRNILVFFALIPIQLSSFLMTLVRKNLCNPSMWTYVYTLTLLLNYFFYFVEFKTLNIVPYSVGVFLLRKYIFTGKYMKYPLWALLIYVDTQVLI